MPRPGEIIIGVAIGAAVLLVVAAAVFVRNRGDATPEPRHSESFELTFETDGSPHIIVESWRGPVTVRGTNGDVVRVEVFRTGTGATEQEAFDNLTRLESRALQEGDTVTVRTYRTDDAPAPAGTRAVIVVFAPADSSVEIVATGDEDVTVADITGAIEVTAEAGIEFDAPPGAAFTLDAVANSGSIEDGIGLDAEPTANGQGETLEASRGDGAQAIVLRAGAGITLSR